MVPNADNAATTPLCTAIRAVLSTGPAEGATIRQLVRCLAVDAFDVLCALSDLAEAGLVVAPRPIRLDAPWRRVPRLPQLRSTCNGIGLGADMLMAVGARICAAGAAFDGIADADIARAVASGVETALARIDWAASDFHEMLAGTEHLRTIDAIADAIDQVIRALGVDLVIFAFLVEECLPAAEERTQLIAALRFAGHTLDRFSRHLGEEARRTKDRVREHVRRAG